MEASTASALIQDGQKLVYVRHAGGPYFLCSNAWGLGVEDVVPSWVWRKEHAAHRVHYLDLRLLEAVVLKSGYTLDYDKPEALKQLKNSYLERRMWKKSDDPEIMEKIAAIWAERGKSLPILSVPTYRIPDAKQLVGARFAFRNGRVLIADGPGCISGDAEIIVNRGGNARRYTLRQAYEGFHGLSEKPNSGWKLPSYTRSIDGNTLRLNRILDIVNKGVKKVVRVITESGRTIEATPDHVFITPTGEHEIGSISVGDLVYVNGRGICNLCGESGDIATFKYAKFPGTCKTCIYRRRRKNTQSIGEYIDKDGYVVIGAGIRYHPRVNRHGMKKHRLVVEAARNNMPYKEFMAKLAVGEIHGFEFLSADDIVHHEDGNKENNHISNLMVTTASAHAKEHAQENTLHLWNVQGPKTEKIISIEDAGEKEVFDIMMEGPHHTFVANGFVVHNCGKTTEALYAVLLNKINQRPFKTLVICPTSVKGSWIDDADALGGLRVLTLSGAADERGMQYDQIDKADLVIASQDSFTADYAELAKYGFNILILDEGHGICNKDNKLTQILIGSKKIRKTFMQVTAPHSVYILTGTPLSNKLDDLYPLLKLLDPGVMSWGGFLNRYTVREEGVRWMWKFVNGVKKKFPQRFNAVVGYINHDELKAKLRLHMIRRTKDEALPNLPKKRFKTVDVEFSPTERKVYEDLKKTFVAKIGDKNILIKSKLEFMTKASQICNSLETVRDADGVIGAGSNESSKLAEMMRWVHKIAPHNKIVIFSRSSEMTTIIARECAEYNPIHFHGAVPDKKRKALIDSFQKDPTRRIFVSTIKAGGIGVTLTAGNVVMLYDRWWSPGANTQAADRCHRRTQMRPVLVLSFRVKNSFDEYVEKVWMTKQEMVSDMVGDEEVIAKLTAHELAEML